METQENAGMTEASSTRRPGEGLQDFYMRIRDGEDAMPASEDAAATGPDEEEAKASDDSHAYAIHEERRRQAAISDWEANVRALAAHHGGSMPLDEAPMPSERQVRLTEAEPTDFTVREDLESELVGLISECRFLMRAVAYPSARLSADPNMRIRFVETACALAESGAKVGKVVAMLRTREPVREVRQTITVGARRGEAGG